MSVHLAMSHKTDNESTCSLLDYPYVDLINLMLAGYSLRLVVEIQSLFPKVPLQICPSLELMVIVLGLPFQKVDSIFQNFADQKQALVRTFINPCFLPYVDHPLSASSDPIPGSWP